MATNNPIRGLLASPFLAGLVIAGCAFTMCAGDAMAQRGGGGRGGGGASRGGGGGSSGGRMAQSSVSGGNRGGSANRGSSGGGNRNGNNGGNYAGGGNSSSRSTQVNGGDRTRTSGDRTTNIGSNNNVNIDRGDVNIDVEGGCCGYGGGGWGYRHPVAAGVTIGAIAGSVAAATGAYYYSLPPSGCVTVVRAGANYYQCGTAYYQQAMSGDTVVYVSASP